MGPGTLGRSPSLILTSLTAPSSKEDVSKQKGGSPLSQSCLEIIKGHSQSCFNAFKLNVVLLKGGLGSWHRISASRGHRYGTGEGAAASSPHTLPGPAPVPQESWDQCPTLPWTLTPRMPFEQGEEIPSLQDCPAHCSHETSATQILDADPPVAGGVGIKICFMPCKGSC